jgi:hypothetical protein
VFQQSSTKRLGAQLCYFEVSVYVSAGVASGAGTVLSIIPLRLLLALLAFCARLHNQRTRAWRWTGADVKTPKENLKAPKI